MWFGYSFLCSYICNIAFLKNLKKVCSQSIIRPFNTRGKLQKKKVPQGGVRPLRPYPPPPPPSSLEAIRSKLGRIRIRLFFKGRIRTRFFSVYPNPVFFLESLIWIRANPTRMKALKVSQVVYNS